MSWSTPPCTSGSSEKSASVSNTSARSSFSGGVCGRISVPASKASARIGAECGSVATPGRSSAKKAALLRRNGRWRGNSRIATSSLGGPSLIDSWRKGRAIDASAVKVVSRFTNIDACSSATGATSVAVSASALKKRPSCVCRFARLVATGSRSSTQRAQLVDGGVQVPSAAGEAGAVAVERVARADARLVVEHVEEVVDLHDLGPRLADRHRGARGEAGLAAPGHDLEVLEAERRARPHEHGGVGGQRLDLLVQLQRDLGVGGAVRPAHRLDLRHLAHARAADAHVEALDQLGGVRQVGLQVVGGHERQAGVRVVGEEDRDDRDQHGHRAHQHGAGGQRGARAARAHLSAPSR